MDTIFLKLLDKVREEAGCRVDVNSGFRCLKHNKEIGGVEHSWHTKGKSADCVPNSISLNQLSK